MFSDSMMLGGGRKAAFSIANSVRLDGVADYFTRTPTVVGNRKTWTFSVWFKPANLGISNALLGLSNNGTTYAQISFDGTTGHLSILGVVSASTEYLVVTAAQFRDQTAWYHVQVAVDTTQATAANRMKVYINGAQITSFLSTIYPALNSDTLINSIIEHRLGWLATPASYQLDGYLASPILVDGAALDPSHFGETDPVTGSWRPKRYVGQVATYGDDITQPGMSVTGTFNHALNCGPITALIDNTTQPAADNAGHTATSHFVIDLGDGNAQPVRQAVLTNHTSTGINVAGITWGCWFSDDNATFTLAASKLMETGLGTVNRFDIPDVGAHRYWKFGYLSGAVSGDCWLQEVSLHTATAIGYGTNGFHLDFADAADLGKDVSGKGNSWLPVSLGGADVVADSPTNNFATWNPLTVVVNGTDVPALINRGCLTAQTSSSGSVVCRAMATQSLSTHAKQWIEMRIDAFPSGSLAGKALSVALGEETAFPWSESSTSVGRRAWELYVQASGATAVATGMNTSLGQIPGYSPAVGDTIVFAYDPGNRHLWLGILPAAGILTWVGGGSPESGASPTWILPADVGPLFSMCAIGGGSTSGIITANFGQRAFAHTPPAGFKSLCTANLPKPVIQAPSKHMDVVTYTGTGMSQDVTGLDFQPDLVWCKRRDNIESHGLYDSVRGPTKMLYSDLSNGEATDTNGIVSFNANGFAANGAMATNGSGGNYVAWCWKAGGAPVANTAGSIPSTVSANPTAGFSIVKYAGTSIAGISFGHGLSAAPKLILVKNTSSANRNANTMDWMVFHAALGNSYQMRLNTTEGNLGPDASMWNSTAPSTTVVTLGMHERVNYAGDNYIAYCWAEVPGFSKFGSYTGNGSSDGPFVHCGFRPRWLMRKCVTSAYAWDIYDCEREAWNDNSFARLTANTADAENTANTGSAGSGLDILSNGFKCRGDHVSFNGSGQTYIYAAFAEAPLGGAKTVPAKAR